MNSFRKFGQNAKSWPFEEARKVLKRSNNSTTGKDYVLFETGYGPSGLPHIGTFGEVVRTTMVRQAFQLLSDTPTRLFAISDDIVKELNFFNFPIGGICSIKNCTYKKFERRLMNIHTMSDKKNAKDEYLTFLVLEERKIIFFVLSFV